MTRKIVLLTAIGIAVGAIAGYMYYSEIGCVSGTCAITSKPLNSTLYGALMGGLVFNMFVKSPKKLNNIGKSTIGASVNEGPFFIP